MSQDEGKICELCKREHIPLTKHHVIPKTLHSNKWFKKRFSREERQHTIELCRPCHTQIHLFFSHKELARHRRTAEKLLEDERVKDFVEWIKKKS